MILDALPPEMRPQVQVIDDWVTNRRLGLLLEARVGGGQLAVCSIDLENDLEANVVARQFRRSLLDYLASDRFAPSVAVSAEQIRGLFTAPSVMKGSEYEYRDKEAQPELPLSAAQMYHGLVASPRDYSLTAAHGKCVQSSMR